MDHYRADVPDGAARLLLRPAAAADILRRGRVPVAVGQKLRPVGESAAHEAGHLFIRVDGVAGIGPVAALIGLQHPGCATLGGAVQKNLPALQAKPAHGRLPTGGRRELRGLLEVGVAHHIGRKDAGPGGGGEHLKLIRAGEAVLDQRDAAGKVDLLGRVQGRGGVSGAVHGDLGGGLPEGELFQIAAGGPAVGLPADASALRVGGLRRHAHQGQGLGVGHAHVSGGVGDEHRRTGKEAVQDLTGGVYALGEHIVVVAKAHDPGVGRQAPRFREGAQGKADLLEGVRRAQLAQGEGGGQGRDVGMGVQERGKEGTALQVDPTCAGDQGGEL